MLSQIREPGNQEILNLIYIWYFSRQGTNGYVYLDLDENFAYWLYYVLDHRFDFKIQSNITHRAPGRAGEDTLAIPVPENLTYILQVATSPCS